MSKSRHSPLAQYLHEILLSKRVRNSRYSLRAFARDLTISPARLSEIFSLKYAPGHQAAEKMMTALKLDSHERRNFWALLEEHNHLYRETYGAKIITDTAVEIIVDYDHYSLMNLMTTDTYCSSPSWAAARLGVSTKKILEMLDRLVLFGLITIDQTGHFTLTNKKLTTTQDIPSDCLKEAHRRLLHHAISSLDQDPVEQRDITSITFTIDPSYLPEAKVMIRDFRRRMAALFEAAPKKEVYNLNIQLVPVTRPATESSHDSKNL